MNLRGVPIGVRLGGAFAIVLALLAFVVVGGNVMSELAMRNLAAGQVAANAKGALAETMKSSLLEAAVAMRNIGLQTEVADMSREEDRVKEQRKRYAAARDKLAALGLNDAEKGILDNVAALDREMEQPFIEAVGQSLNFNSEVAAKAITGRITRPIGYAVGVASRVAQGDLTSDVRVEGRDEAAQLLQALGGMNESL